MRRQPPENVGSSPNRKSYRGVEQWLARKAHNLEVAGSNPTSATKVMPGEVVKVWVEAELQIKYMSV